MNKNRPLTTTDAAKELDVSRSRIYALIKSGRLKAEAFGRDYLIHFADLDAVRVRTPGRPPRKESKE